MKIRAVIFDVYSTMLQVGPAPANAAESWQTLHAEMFKSPPPMSLLEFSIACNRAIQLRHAAAQARGIRFPEILWPTIVAEVLPAFTRLAPDPQNEFVFRHIQLGRTVALMTDVAPVLRRLTTEKRSLGIASNAQAYSQRELEICLTVAGLSLEMFEPDLCYWSYRHGFSKPDPYVFQILRARLEARGISSSETLMVGDRVDNDIEPAQAQGFKVWHLTRLGAEKTAGDWKRLDEFLAQAG